MRVLVTGASGFVGSHVCQMIEERTDWEVTPFDLDDDWDDVPDTDVVVSLAASADPKEALAYPWHTYRNDIWVMLDTLEYARRVGARVLHVSTNEVYGPGSNLPYRPRGPYAGGKACQEIVCQTYPDVQTTIVVTQSLFGERQQPDKLVPSVMRNLLTDQPVKLQKGPEGWAARPFLHVANLADALLHLAENQNGSRVHVGADEMVSVETVARMLATELGCKLQLEAIPAGDRVGHETKVRPIGHDIPGWRPYVGLASGLASTASWYLGASLP